MKRTFTGKNRIFLAISGVIILVASCCDGIGGVHFEKLMRIGNEDEIDDFLSKIPPKESIPEQWCAQIFARILKKHKLILVSDLDAELVTQLNMIPAAFPDEALDKARQIVGRNAEVVVIPDGVAVLAVNEE